MKHLLCSCAQHLAHKTAFKPQNGFMGPGGQHCLCSRLVGTEISGMRAQTEACAQVHRAAPGARLAGLARPWKLGLLAANVTAGSSLGLATPTFFYVMSQGPPALKWEPALVLHSNTHPWPQVPVLGTGSLPQRKWEKEARDAGRGSAVVPAQPFCLGCQEALLSTRLWQITPWIAGRTRY